MHEKGMDGVQAPALCRGTGNMTPLCQATQAVHGRSPARGCSAGCSLHFSSSGVQVGQRAQKRPARRGGGGRAHSCECNMPGEWWYGEVDYRSLVRVQPEHAQQKVGQGGVSAHLCGCSQNITGER